MKRKGIAALLALSMVLAAGGTGGMKVSAAEDTVTFKIAVLLNPLNKDEDFNKQKRQPVFILSGFLFQQLRQGIRQTSCWLLTFRMLFLD